jgi:hypothetical protein
MSSNHDEEWTDMSDAEATDAGPVDDDLASLLAKREHARPNRFTWAMLVLLVLALGFLGGAFVQKQFGSASTAGFPDMSAAAGGSGAAFSGGLPGGQPAGMTVGTVKLVDGNKLYVTDTSGQTVTVTVPKTATITAQQDVALADLAAGTTVIIRGETADDGTVTATSVSQGSLPGGGPPAASGTGSTSAPLSSQAPAPSQATGTTTQEGN